VFFFLPFWFSFSFLGAWSFIEALTRSRAGQGRPGQGTAAPPHLTFFVRCQRGVQGWWERKGG
jgi:hypothetical protein